MDYISAAATQPLNGWATFAGLAICVAVLLAADIIWREVMSKSKVRAKHKITREVIADGITRGIEREVWAKRISRADANFWYEKLRAIGLKELGPEPSFGKPWYYGVAAYPSVEALKHRIKVRLGLMNNKEEPVGRTDIDEILKKFS